MISNSTTNILPTLSIVTKNIQKTYASFDITTNLDGHIFYELKLSPLNDPLELEDLKFSIK